MDNTYAAIYRKAVLLAKDLGLDPHDVPLPFALNELENHYAWLQEQARLRDEGNGPN